MDSACGSAPEADVDLSLAFPLPANPVHISKSLNLSASSQFSFYLAVQSELTRQAPNAP